MKILYINRSSVSQTPPAQSVIRGLLDLGMSVDILAPTSKEEIDTRFPGRIEKVYSLKKESGIAISRELWQVIRKIDLGEYDYVWIYNPDALLPVWGTIPVNKIIFHLLETYDSGPFYYQKFLKYVIPKLMNVIVAEYNRSFIVSALYGAKKLPFVLYNKPYLNDFLDQTEAVQKSSDCRCFIYQGVISEERPLHCLIEAFDFGRGDCKLWIQSKRAQIEKYYPKFLHSHPDCCLDFQPPPNHLLVTQKAHCGVISYDYKQLNTCFCAPNKIWEYAKFGLPVLSSDCPSLRYLSWQFKCFEFVDMGDVGSIKLGVDRILNNYDSMSKEAYNLFDSYDYLFELRRILNDLV